MMQTTENDASRPASSCLKALLPPAAPARSALPREEYLKLPAPAPVLGVPLDPVTTGEAIAAIEAMIASGRPHYAATANVDFLAQAMNDVELRRLLFEAHLVLCDGTPLLWAAQLLGVPLPERVAGSDLVPLLMKVAEDKGYRVYFLGGDEQTGAVAMQKLRAAHPHLQIAGHFSPPFKPLLEMEHAEIERRIRAARPDILFVCFGCPKQEKWIGMHYRSLGVPLAMGVGGTIDFLAGRLARAPMWMRKTGTEWLFRLAQEPRRLAGRYGRDMWLFGGGMAQEWLRSRRPAREEGSRAASVETVSAAWERCRFPEWLDQEAVGRNAKIWEALFQERRCCLANLSRTRFVDHAGAGLLVRLHKRMRLLGGRMLLEAPSDEARDALRAMRLDKFWEILPQEAEEAPAPQAEEGAQQAESSAELRWVGEVTAANVKKVWEATEAFLDSPATTAAGHGVIDLSGLKFIDSTGVSLMIRARKHAGNAKVLLVFRKAQPDVRNVIRICRLEELLLGGNS